VVRHPDVHADTALDLADLERQLGPRTVRVGPTQRAIENWREPTRNNGQTASRQNPESTARFRPRTNPMTSDY
jgi:hypothetical protein